MSNIFSDFKKYMNEDLSVEQLQRIINIKTGQENFRTYCNLVNPEFFKSERKYQDILCNTFQDFYENKLLNENGEPCDIFLLTIPPGFGKSYTTSLFASWIYGKDVKNQVIEVSYNQTLSIQFSKTVRDLINDMEIINDENYYTVNSFFPNVKIKYGDAGMERWSLEGYYNSYLSTSFDGSITGMRGSLGIIDDPIKNADEAVNENIKAKHWNFYKNTFSSRILDGGKQIIIQTRWATDDLAGKLSETFPERCFTLSMQALDENNQSLCEDLYSTTDLLKKETTLDEHIWSANYMQIPIDLKGALYGEFKTYDAIDFDSGERFISYTDTADEGADFLCTICGVVVGKYGYVTDIYYTDKSMETTEPETARRLHQAGVREALVESNNGGRGFARNLIAELKKLNNKKCTVTWFHQSKNKRTRIIVNATNVMEQVIMPEDWKRKFPEFYKEISTYQRKGKNKHDDAPDTLTGFVEVINGDVKGVNKARILNRRIFGGMI